ncbi:MAG: pyridoxal phosphate-dependent aminotransferase [Clostridiales bacterium]|nr:pyridoxal phosphate-dependent aminotransferase [Clostridiales bacterium]
MLNVDSRFDQQIDRRGTDCLKYDYARERGKAGDLLPMWVADMDFRAPDGVLEALHRSVEHGVFGYTEPKEAYYQALAEWMRRRFGWEIRREWVVKTPGVVYALAAAIRCLTQPGDGVLIQQPVYYPFPEVIRDNGRVVVNNALVLEDGVYRMDLRDFEEQVTARNVRLFLLCSPHNPVGRVWSRTELEAVGDICVRHGVTVVSDEIHADIVYPGNRHLTFANLKPEFARSSIVCTSPSKSFNLAGFQVSNIIIPDSRLRRTFRKEIDRTGYSQLNGLGLTACRAAYETGEPWLEELIRYLRENITYLRAFLRDKLPRIRLIEPEGTYLVWLDMRELGLPPDMLNRIIEDQAKLWLDAGEMFGEEGAGFQRINVACPRATLEQAMTQLYQALQQEL